MESMNITELNNDCKEHIFKDLTLDDLLNLADSSKHFHTAVCSVFQRRFRDATLFITTKSRPIINREVDITLIVPQQQHLVLKILRMFGQFISCLIRVIRCISDAPDIASVRFTDVFNRYLNDYCHESLHELYYSFEEMFQDGESLHLEMLSLRNVHTIYLKNMTFVDKLPLNQYFPKLHSLYLNHVAPVLVQVNIPTMKHLYVEVMVDLPLWYRWYSQDGKTEYINGIPIRHTLLIKPHLPYIPYLPLYAIGEYAKIFELNPQLECLQFQLFNMPKNECHISSDFFQSVNQHLKNLKRFGFYTSQKPLSNLDGEMFLDTVETFEVDSKFYGFRFPKLKELRSTAGLLVLATELDCFAHLENITTMKFDRIRGSIEKMFQLDNLLQNLVDVRINSILLGYFEDWISFCRKSKSLKTFVVSFYGLFENFRHIFESYERKAQELEHKGKTRNLQFTVESIVGRAPMNCVIVIASIKNTYTLMDLSTYTTDWDHIRYQFPPFEVLYRSNGTLNHYLNYGLWLKEHEHVEYWRSMTEQPYEKSYIENRFRHGDI